MATTSPASEPPSDRERSTRKVWLVGVDGSPSSRHAALWAAGHVDGRAAGLHLVTAWHAPFMSALTAWGVPPEAGSGAVEDSSRAHIEQLATEIRSSVGVPVETIVTQGGAASSLLEAAGHGSLLVVGSRGRGGFARLALGSTSTQCATHADVATAVIPAGAPIGSVRRLIVAIDGSAHSLAAARWAIDFADAGTTVECVMAWDVTPLVASDELVVLPEATDLVRKRFSDLMHDLRRSTDRRDIEITHRFEEGVPRHVLRTTAQRGDLFVIGARGQGAVSSIILGSVSSWLLHHVDRPIVVVPQAGDENS